MPERVLVRWSPSGETQRWFSESAEILFVPSTRLATEIVARTAVTVMYQQGDAKPSTSVQTTSVEAIEENIRKANGTRSGARLWTAEDIDEEFRQMGNPAIKRLLEFAKVHSADGIYTSSGKTTGASFGFYVRGLDGETSRRFTVFSCTTSWSFVCIYLDFAGRLLTEPAMDEFRQQLRSVFGAGIDMSKKAPGVSLDVVAQHLDEFLQAMLWYKQQAAANLDTAN